MFVKLPAVALLVAVGSASAAAIASTVTYGTAEKTFNEDPDFGLCIPTMKYAGGLGGRSSMEFTFLPADPLCAKGQQEALNPNIITNRICDQLMTACGANEPAKQLCREAQTKIRALGTRNKSTADTWNTLMGFDGALTDPDGGLTEPAHNTDLKRDVKREVKRDVQSEKRAFIACSASEWIDDCTGWPAAAAVVKRDVASAPKAEPVAVIKKEAAPEPMPVVKRDVEPVKRSASSKRQVEFIPCSASVWIDNCTGWP